MRQVTFTAAQFGTFVFPILSRSDSGSDGEFETALRLIRKLKDTALTEPIPLTQEEKDAVLAPGQRQFQLYRLREDSATFLLEEDEWSMLRARLQRHRAHIALIMAEEFQELLSAIGSAPQVAAEGLVR